VWFNADVADDMPWSFEPAQVGSLTQQSPRWRCSAAHSAVLDKARYCMLDHCAKTAVLVGL
jgi:hypothetical protein